MGGQSTDFFDDQIEMALRFLFWRNFLVAGTSIPPLTLVIISDDVWAIVDRKTPIIIYQKRHYYLVPQGEGQGYGVPLQEEPYRKGQNLVDPKTQIIKYEVRDI